MKVLFAVNDENISAEIVKKYQKDYKEIISYKNVYFYNAILKELQRDKSYDRIVISEDLEEFTSTSYEQRDKFIFDKLDEISDEALDSEQDNISILLICSDRRSKADDILVKFFGIGIYNAIIGNDRSVDQVCKLINKPRSKKQAKIYYNIETEEVGYKPENENDVDEEEMRNILNHFKRLGNDEDKYVKSFKNIVSQYNENQLKIIVSVLPLNVKAILEEKSPEYQKIVALTGKGLKTMSARQKISKMNGPSEKLLMSEAINKTSKPVVVPATMGSENVKKMFTGKIKPAEVSYDNQVEDDDEFEDIDNFEDLDSIEEQEIVEKPKKRGRPRKNTNLEQNDEDKKPKKRGRPKKQVVQDFQEALPGFEDMDNKEEFEDEQFDNLLPGFEEEDKDDNQLKDDELYVDNILPGMEDENEESDYEEYDDEDFANEKEQEDSSNRYYAQEKDTYSDIEREESFAYSKNFDKDEYESLLTAEKKIAAFLGTTKNGTSFIINCVAEYLSKLGVNVAILDATSNKNSYYIYTKNEESLRKNAINSFQNLIMGNPYGVQVNSNLTVYTGIPSGNEQIKNFGPILQTLAKNHTCVLIDCDFTTPKEYFANAQELYLVQSMDILTIQPLTAFLRELKSKNALDANKISVIINKVLKLRGITTKNIIGGMAYYNDPEMSFMTELFDRNNVSYFEVPFMEEVYTKYLSGIVDCEISLSNYPKEFKNIIKGLAEKIYKLAPRQAISKHKKERIEPSYATSFSSSMNNTLNNMKKKY